MPGGKKRPALSRALVPLRAKVYTLNPRAQLPPVSSNLSSRLLHGSLRRQPLPIVSLPLGRVFAQYGVFSNGQTLVSDCACVG
jgi:hypothetical protein